MKYDPNKAGCRLKEMRDSKKWSQSQMALALAEIITERVLDRTNGKNTVSQLERSARGITLDYAFAYAEIFDVSLDYVLGRTDDWKPDFKPIKKMIGFSDICIEELRRFQEAFQFDDDKPHPLSLLMEKGFVGTLGGLDKFISDYCTEKIKANNLKAENKELYEHNQHFDGMIKPFVNGVGKTVPGRYIVDMNIDSYYQHYLRKFEHMFTDVVKKAIEAKLEKDGESNG